MIRLLADENFNGRILDGVFFVDPDADIIRAQDTEIYQAADPVVLEWAAANGRIILTHDRETFINYAYQRVKDGKPMPGVFVAAQELDIGVGIEQILTIIGASDPKEWVNRVEFLPL